MYVVPIWVYMLILLVGGQMFENKLNKNFMLVYLYDWLLAYYVL